MSASIFDDKLIEPDAKMLSMTLGETTKFYDKICQFIQDEFGDLRPEWKFYNKKSGWILKLFNKKRNVLFLVPHEGYFHTTFIFGEKAFELILAGDFSDPIKQDLLAAKKYVEGRGIPLNIKTAEDCASALSLIKVKLSS